MKTKLKDGIMNILDTNLIILNKSKELFLKKFGFVVLHKCKKILKEQLKEFKIQKLNTQHCDIIKYIKSFQFINLYI